MPGWLDLKLVAVSSARARCCSLPLTTEIPVKPLTRAPPKLPLHVQGEAISGEPLERIEIIWNGEVIRSIQPQNASANNAYVSRFDLTIPANGSGWLAARCVARPLDTGGIPFAHTGPWHVEIAGKPLVPKRREVEYFIQRVDEEIERNRTILTPDQMADYYRGATSGGRN